MKPKLTIEALMEEAKAFCERESEYDNKDLFGVTDGKPEQGYLTVSNALQWRLQYGRIVKLAENIDGIVRIVNNI